MMCTNVGGTAAMAIRTSEYQYHATTPTALFSIYEQGLKPNNGMHGKGVYFAPSEQGATDWTDYSTGGKKLLRVKTQTLQDKYDWWDMDNAQSLSKKKISSKDIEIKDGDKWMSMEEFVKSKKTSYKMWKASKKK